MILDTRDIAAAERFEFWRNFITRRFMALTMSAARPNYFGRIEIHGLENACMVFARGGGYSSVRGEREIALDTGERPDWLLIRANVAMHIKHCGRDSSLKAGDLMLIDTRRPYERANSPIDCTVLAMPDSLLGDWRATLENCAGYHFSSEREWSKLLSAHLAGVSPELMCSIGRYAALRAMFTKNLVFMLVQMLLCDSSSLVRIENVNAHSEQARVNLYNLMLLWIRDHYDDPQLTAGQLAQAFNVSLRHVHKLFATYSDGRWFQAYLQNTRLEHAIRLLGSGADAGSSISDISWRCGFADTSSFGRLFKRNYGVTPGAYRRMQLKADLKTSDSQ